MFTQEERARLRSKFLDYAAGDPCISGAAITGSAAADREDRWSDIDLAFGVNDPAEIPNVLCEWTDRMYRDQSALHHFDVRFETWIYRVFLLSSTLQVDLAFVPAANFRALAPTFRLAYGRANEPQHTPPPTLTEMIGFSWLYAVHGRSCMARQNLWQAEYMISGVRDHALAIACIRHGLPAKQGRGMDLLPRAVVAPFEDSFVQKLDIAELSRAFRTVVRGLLGEIRCVDEELAGQLQGALTGLTDAIE